MTRFLLDVSVTPDFTGLPANVHGGLVQLTNNAAALLTLVAALGVVISLLCILFANWTSNPQLSERGKNGILLSVFSMALLYIGIAAINYSARLFQ